MGSIHEKNQGPKISCYCTFKAGGLWEMGQLISNIGPSWSEVCAMLLWPSHQVSHLLQSYFKGFISCINVITVSLNNTVHIFLHCRLKINHMKELRHLHLFFGPSRMVKNR